MHAVATALSLLHALRCFKVEVSSALLEEYLTHSFATLIGLQFYQLRNLLYSGDCIENAVRVSHAFWEPLQSVFFESAFPHQTLSDLLQFVVLVATCCFSGRCRFSFG